MLRNYPTLRNSIYAAIASISVFSIFKINFPSREDKMNALRESIMNTTKNCRALIERAVNSNEEGIKFVHTEDFWEISEDNERGPICVRMSGSEESLRLGHGTLYLSGDESSTIIRGMQYDRAGEGLELEIQDRRCKVEEISMHFGGKFGEPNYSSQVTTIDSKPCEEIKDVAIKAFADLDDAVKPLMERPEENETIDTL